MQLLIFEPEHSGHYLNYVRMLTQEAAGLGIDTIAALNRAAPTSTQFRTHLASAPSAIRWDFSVPAPEGNKRQTIETRVTNLRRLISEHRPDVVWIPHADGLAANLMHEELCGAEVEALLMHGAFAYPGLSWKKWWAGRQERAALRQAPWRTQFILDELVLEFLHRSKWKPSCPLVHMPDPVDPPLGLSTAEARRKLNIPEDGRYVAMIGRADRRKGADLLLLAFAKARLPRTDRLLFVGPISPSLERREAQCIASLKNSGRLIHLDGYVEQATFLAGIDASNVVCTPYPLHVGSSSIVIRAAAAGRYVLGSDYGLVGAMIGKHRLGSAVRVKHIGTFARALRDSLDAASAYQPSPQAREWVSFHTPANFAATWSTHIRGRLGLIQAARG